MDVDAKDIIVALQNQRNGALDETAQLYAMLEAAKREIEKLKQLINNKATDGTDRDTVFACDWSKQAGQ